MGQLLMEQAQIKSLLEAFDKSDAVSLRIKNENFSIEMKKKDAYTGSSAPATQVASLVPAQEAPMSATIGQPAPVQSSEPKSGTVNASPLATANGECIKSPMVGTFYSAPSPEAGPFVSVGDTVRKDKTVAIVEAMKMMNEIGAEFDCRIVEVLVENGQPIEYGMPLFLVERV